MNDFSELEPDLMHPAKLPPCFEAFFAQHQRVFLAVATSRLRDRRDAEEAVMEAGLRMHAKWGQMLSHANPMALALKILNGIVCDFYRRQARYHRREHIVATPPDISYLQELRSHEQLDRAMDKLEKIAPIQANCVRLRYLVGLSYDQIAQWLDTTPGAARTNVHHGLQRLRELMEHPVDGGRDT
ncbi:RNA polymerase sigma factor [Streptomyces sp. TRM 70361]|uniref:RNA polymerase sigma factor n=1 Tax=Streptomyces sp. TRM 70361 TaxID=3116553 RepID=UPI002E7AEB46|nr:RNA polymerase sigma factor [Streptomyces sp. TRM 70361]MEE1943273.1 RNA polymerase sigma factor [Streptomyces sp. TRM 70361]